MSRLSIGLHLQNRRLGCNRLVGNDPWDSQTATLALRSQVGQGEMEFRLPFCFGKPFRYDKDDVHHKPLVGWFVPAPEPIDLGMSARRN